MTTASGSGPVVVSPHLDDAVLSAAVQLMRPGARLVTACTASPPAGAALGVWDRLTGATDAGQRLRDRLVEDDAALAVLGVTGTVRLDWPDDQHVPARTRELPAQLVDRLRAELTGAAEVWVPAAIGHHPDHVAVRDAALTVADPQAAIHHYADVPYSVRYGWPPSVTGGEPASPYVDVEFWLAEELADAGLDAADLTRTVHLLDADQQRRKVAAMSCYATQIPALDIGDMLAAGDPAVLAFELSWTRS
jgi:LmbE family N-acetylglucosaminyl deacetylase